MLIICIFAEHLCVGKGIMRWLVCSTHSTYGGGTKEEGHSEYLVVGSMGIRLGCLSVKGRLRYLYILYSTTENGDQATKRALSPTDNNTDSANSVRKKKRGDSTVKGNTKNASSISRCTINVFCSLTMSCDCTKPSFT